MLVFWAIRMDVTALETNLPKDRCLSPSLAVLFSQPSWLVSSPILYLGIYVSIYLIYILPKFGIRRHFSFLLLKKYVLIWRSIFQQALNH